MEVWRPCLQRGPGAEPLALIPVSLNGAWYHPVLANEFLFRACMASEMTGALE